MNCSELKDRNGIVICEGDTMNYDGVRKKVAFINGEFGVLTPNENMPGSSFGSYQIEDGYVEK